MTEYIDREKIFSIWRSMPAPASVTSLAAAISQTPAANVVPVVRCNECKYHEIEPEKLKLGDIPPKQGECWCNWWDSAVNLSGFCSCGERITE